MCLEIVMTPYAELTRAGQFRHLRSLALRGLAAYALGEASFSPLKYVQNATFLVRACGSTERFLLRVHAPRWRECDEIRSELLWLHIAALFDGYRRSRALRDEHASCLSHIHRGNVGVPGAVAPESSR